MSAQARRWIVQAAVGIALGLAAGFAVGWWLWPVQYTNTPPSALRQDYRDDYVLMVATVYEADGDLVQASRWLAQVDAQDTAAPVIDLAERLIASDGSPDEIAYLARLAWGLGASTPTLLPYLEDRP